MVGFINELPIEEDSDKVSKEWFEDKSIEETESGVCERSMEVDREQGSEHIPTGNQIRPGLEPNVNESKTTMSKSEQHVVDPNSTSILCEPVVDVLRMKVEEEALDSDANVRFCVENEMGKVSFIDCQEISILDQSNGKSVSLSGYSENRSTCLEESESNISSSSSSSSSSDDDNDEEEDSSDHKEGVNGHKIELNIAGKTEGDDMDNLEEGEIRDEDEIETVHADGYGDGDDGNEDEEENGEHMNFGNIELDDTDDDDEAVGVPKGPIRSKNELEKLPPVPKVVVVLQPYHQILPVGVILSVIGTKVIVEGSQKHNPLNEGSILWITESKLPLGLVDEIFGPVKKPYYVVRYNSEAEVPVGIYEGALVSFVQEFADHVLNDKNLYAKGYDASGENDEEMSINDEFSDDEKEAQYRKMQKLAKRGMNEQTPGNKKNNKKVQHKGAPWRNDRHHAEMRLPTTIEPAADSNRYNYQMESGNSQNNQPAMQPTMVSGAGLVRPFPVMQPAGLVAPPTGSGMWFNRMPSQELQTPFFQSGFANRANPSIPPNNQLHPYPMPMFMPFQQQMFDPSQYPLPNMPLTGVQPNFGSSGPWAGNGLQVGFNQSIPAMSMHGHQQSTVDVQGVLPNAQQPSVPPGSFGASQPFNLRGPPTRGKKNIRGGRFRRK